MSGSRDTSAFRSVHRLVEHYTPDGVAGRLLLGIPAISVAPFLFFGGIAALGSPANVAAFLVALLAAVSSIPTLLVGVFTLWPVYLSLIGNVESPAAYPEGASGPSVTNEHPETVLKRRYAAGELTREEFESRLDDVLDVGESGGARTRDFSDRDDATERDDRSRFETARRR